MRKDVAQFIRSCSICQYCNKSNAKPVGLLQSLPVTSLFHTLALDFVGGFSPTFHGNKHILIAIDLFSKYVVAIPTIDMTSSTIAKFLLDQIGLIFGFPIRLLSDRGSAFLSGAIQDFLNLAKTKKINTSSYHPQCDGQAENAVKTVTKLLTKLALNYPNNWDDLVKFAVYEYNVAFHDSIKTAPFTVVFGTRP